MADTDQVSDAIIAEAESAAETLAQVKAEIAKAVFGQDRVVELALAAVLAGGHALLIGAPAWPRHASSRRWAPRLVSPTSASSSRRI